MSLGQPELSFQEIFPLELPAQCDHGSDPTKLKARASLTSQCLDMVHQTLDGCEYLCETSPSFCLAHTQVHNGSSHVLPSTCSISTPGTTGAHGEGHTSPTALPAPLPSSATSPHPAGLTRASRGESPVRSTPASCVPGQPGWEYLPGIPHCKCRLRQGGSGGSVQLLGERRHHSVRRL